MYSLNLVFALAFAVFFYRGVEQEGGCGLLWAGLSILVSILVLYKLGWGFFGLLLGQIVLFLVGTIFRVIRDRDF